MKKTIISTLLLLVAILLFIPLAPIGMLYGIGASFFRVKIKSGFYKMSKYFKTIAVSIDQLGNVFCKELFDDLLIKNKGHKFGNEDETISSVVGKNKKTKTLSLSGKSLDYVLNKIEKDHSIISIEIDETENTK